MPIKPFGRPEPLPSGHEELLLAYANLIIRGPSSDAKSLKSWNDVNAALSVHYEAEPASFVHALTNDVVLRDQAAGSPLGLASATSKLSMAGAAYIAARNERDPQTRNVDDVELLGAGPPQDPDLRKLYDHVFSALSVFRMTTLANALDQANRGEGISRADNGTASPEEILEIIGEPEANGLGRSSWASVPGVIRSRVHSLSPRASRLLEALYNPGSVVTNAEGETAKVLGYTPTGSYPGGTSHLKVTRGDAQPAELIDLDIAQADLEQMALEAQITTPRTVRAALPVLTSRRRTVRFGGVPRPVGPKVSSDALVQALMTPGSLLVFPDRTERVLEVDSQGATTSVLTSSGEKHLNQISLDGGETLLDELRRQLLRVEVAPGVDQATAHSVEQLGRDGQALPKAGASAHKALPRGQRAQGGGGGLSPR